MQCAVGFFIHDPDEYFSKTNSRENLDWIPFSFVMGGGVDGPVEEDEGSRVFNIVLGGTWKLGELLDADSLLSSQKSVWVAADLPGVREVVAAAAKGGGGGRRQQRAAFDSDVYLGRVDGGGRLWLAEIYRVRRNCRMS